MKRLALVLILLLTPNSCSSTEREVSLGKPNIVILLADDLGWNDVGYHGSSVQTPNIDRLAEQGVQLDRFYVAPWCSPTRAGILTGRYPHSLGYPLVARELGDLGAKKKPGDRDRWGSISGETTIPEVLEGAGYRLRACLGKWHLRRGRNETVHPLHKGFNHFYGHLGGMIGYFDHLFGAPESGIRRRPRDWYRNMEAVVEEGYSTDLLGAEAVRLIEENAQNQPFLIYLAFNAAHYPLQAKWQHLKMYGVSEDQELPTGMFSSDKDLNRRIFSAMVTSMDENIGHVLGALEKKGIADNTLVMFLSDNGGDHKHGASDNSPLRNGKGTVFEGGVRVPAIIRWPSQLKGNRKLSAVMGMVDVLPTLARIAGASAQIGHGLDMFDVLTGAKANKNRAFNLGDEAVVTEKWKLIHGELYRIDVDPGEERNVASDHPEVVERLKKRLHEFEGLNEQYQM